MFNTLSVGELPVLSEELEKLTEQSVAKNGTTSNSASFELFESYDVVVASIDSTTTYTLPIIQPRENNRQFSNLVLTYTNDVLTDIFILKYEGTREYFSNFKEDIYTPFLGSVQLQEINGINNLFAKSSGGCQTFTITLCHNTLNGGIGPTHQANSNCKNESRMWSHTFTKCPASLDSGGSGGGGFGVIDVPIYDPSEGSSGSPDPGNNTTPTPNPCPKSSPGLVDGNGGCYDPEVADRIYNVVSPHIEIQDIAAYLSVFDLNNTATVTIYADQPVSGEDKAYIFPNMDVEHSYITIKQGSKTRSFGFYPDGISKPTAPEEPGIFGDISNYPYDVSVNKTVSPNILREIINESVRYENLDYNLNDNNCTDFAIEIGRIIDFNFGAANNTWPIGSGSNPGSLGQRMRAMIESGEASGNSNVGTSPANSN